MALWLILIAIATAAILLLLAPLWLAPRTTAKRMDFDARIYRDQLSEIDRDAERGTLTPDQAEAARTEIARRLLALESAAAGDAGSPAGHLTADGTQGASKASRRGIAAFVGAFVPIAAFGVYIVTGSPHLPGRPAAEIRADAPGKPPGADMSRLVAQLGERLKERPSDLQGWALYARSLAGLGRFDEAIGAYQRVTALAPRDAEMMSRLAEVQIIAARGMVTPAARASLDATLKLDAAEPRARYYLGIAESQAGKPDTALSIWIALEAESNPEAPWRKLLGERIARLAKTGKITDQQLADRRAKAASRAAQNKTTPQQARGPTSADIKAAQSVPQKDRMAMIRGMVTGLAERLKDQPDDVAGWQRLARSYDVLGEAVKARAAYAHLAKLKPNDVPTLAAYASAIARTLARGAPIPAGLLALGDRILALDPRHAGALWFTGMARAEAGNRDGAVERWTRLLALLDPNSPQYAEVKKSIEALEKKP